MKNILLFYLYLILLFFYSPSNAQSHQIDSLENLLAQTSDSKSKVDLLITIADFKIPFSGEAEIHQAIELAKKIKYVKGLAEGHYSLGLYHYSKNEAILAKENLEESLYYFQLLKDYKSQVSVINLLGDNEYFTNNFSEAISYFLEAEKIAKEINDNLLIGETKFYMSRIYFDGLINKDKALNYLHESIPLIQSDPKSSRILDVYIAFCNYYALLKNSDSLGLYLIKTQEAYNQLEKVDSNPYFATVITEHKGHLHWIKGNLALAEKWFKMAFEEYQKTEDPYIIAEIQLYLAEITLEQEANDKAISYAKTSLFFDDIEFNRDAYEILKKAYKNINVDSFIFYEEQFTQANDSLNELGRLSALHQTINTDQIQKSELLISQQKQSKHTILLAGLFFSFLFGIGLLKFYRRSQHQKVELAILAEEKNHIKTIFSGKDQELETLREKVSSIERSLVASQLSYERQQSTLSNVTTYLKKMVSNEKPENLKRQLRSLSREIESNLNQEDRWELFAKQFEQVHPQFFGLLIQRFPALSNRDLRLCAYVRLGMDNQEIGNILGIEASSVIKARHRMKKKMNLEKEQDLNQFLLNL